MPETSEPKKEKIVEKTVRRKKENKQRFDSIKRYFAETKAEFGKIVWPARKTVVNNTIVVLATILIIGAVIWCLDALTSSGLNAMLKNY